MTEKKITIGIPAYKAENTICDCISSIQILTLKNNIEIVISKDNPEDDYNFVKERFPELDIKIIECNKNTGPGLARQRALDNATTNWITFIDADDVFMGPFAIESLFEGTKMPNAIEVMGTFFQEVQDHPQGIRMTPRNDDGHPWIFGRLYNVKFLKDNNIRFSLLRAMEDGEFNWKLRMLIEGTPLLIIKVDAPIYLWRIGSEHSITRIGTELNDGEPLYNWDLCQVGATAAAINAIKFCKKKNPFNGGITRFTTELMVNQYFTYVKCLERKPLFAEENLFNAKRFYHSCYKDIENQIEKDILKDIYTVLYAGQGLEMIGIIPSITFFEFIDKLKSSEFKGKEEFEKIRNDLPEWVTDLDLKSGVLGSEGYIYCEGEEK